MTAPPRQRMRLEVRGAVQGVGFRPFVYRLATELGLAGWVINDARGVFLEVEGPAERLRELALRLRAAPPPRAVVQGVEEVWLAPAGLVGFEIRGSDGGGDKTVVVLPEVATCHDCLAEVRDPGDRRHRYPFTNCTNCGPRFTIVRELPYDRPNTTMSGFALCPRCLAEYRDPLDRRFHAQPNACPDCGPSLELWDRRGRVLARRHEALEGAAAALRQGEIVAVKGLGGFHLLCDAGSESVVGELRRRKGRYEKPLALMVADLATAQRLCRLEPGAAELLSSPAAPIVLLERRPRAGVAEAVAPGNPRLGLMLPYTPLHHLLLGSAGPVLVATSGNLADEPIATDEREALARLGGIADLFLVHDRPIARHADDSVLVLAEGAPRPLRRARGYAPLPVLLARPGPTLLAVGAQLKNTAALALGERVFLSQHIGDMESAGAQAALARVVADFLRLYEARPVAVVHDLHPDYAATAWARAVTGGAAPSAAGLEALRGLPLVGVQHHHAHLASCLADAGVEGPALGVIWDGTGYGPDGTVWGGEMLLGDAGGYERVAHLRPFRLPGGEAAVREPRRVALALLWQLFGAGALGRADLAPVRALTPVESRVFGRLLEGGFSAPLTTSAGRLFDAVAALLDLRQRSSFEGQAAMDLEHAADPAERSAYPLPLAPPDAPGAPRELDWRALLEALLVDSRRGVGRGIIAARFHNALAQAIVDVARWLGEGRVALSGGCFQNRRLMSEACRRLRAAGFEVILHRQVPANDGGLALGQVAVAAARLASGGT